MRDFLISRSSVSKASSRPGRITAGLPVIRQMSEWPSKPEELALLQLPVLRFGLPVIQHSAALLLSKVNECMCYGVHVGSVAFNARRSAEAEISRMSIVPNSKQNK